MANARTKEYYLNSTTLTVRAMVRTSLVNQASNEAGPIPKTAFFTIRCDCSWIHFHAPPAPFCRRA